MSSADTDRAGIQSSAVRAAGRNPFCHPLRGTLCLYLSLTVDTHHLLPSVVSASHASFSAHRNLVLFFITPVGQAVSETKKCAHLSAVSSFSPLLNNISDLCIISSPIANPFILVCYFLSRLCYCLLISWLTHLQSSSLFLPNDLWKTDTLLKDSTGILSPRG